MEFFQKNDTLNYPNNFGDLYLDHFQITVYYPDDYKLNPLWNKTEVFDKVNKMILPDSKTDILNGGLQFTRPVLYADGIVKEKPIIRFSIDEDKMRIVFHGMFFKGKNINSNLAEIHAYEKLFFYNKFSLIKKISRIDIACNLYTIMENIEFINPYECKTDKRLSASHREKEKLSYMYCGSSKSKESAQLVIYDKRTDQAHKKNNAIDRFNTYDFCRAEFRMPSQCLRKHNISTLSDVYLLSENDWWKVWSNLNGGKSFRFKSEHLPKTCRPQYTKRIQTRDYFTTVKSQILGIMRKLSLAELSELIYKGTLHIRTQKDDSGNNIGSDKFLKFTSWLTDKTIQDQKGDFKKMGVRFIK